MNISKAFIVEILLLIELFQSVQNESPMVFVCKSFHGVSSKNDKAASALCMKRKGGGLVSLARRDIVRARYAAEVSDHLQAIFSNGGRGIWSCGGGIEEDVIQGITVYNVIVSPDRTSVHVQVRPLGNDSTSLRTGRCYGPKTSNGLVGKKREEYTLQHG